MVYFKRAIIQDSLYRAIKSKRSYIFIDVSFESEWEQIGDTKSLLKFKDILLRQNTLELHEATPDVEMIEVQVVV